MAAAERPMAAPPFEAASEPQSAGAAAPASPPVGIDSSTSPPPTSPPTAAATAEEDEERVCRICRGGDNDDEGGPLYHPCKCSGSIRHVHEICLERWLARTNKTACELCSEEIRFQAVYADGTESAPRLPPAKLMAGLARRLGIFGVHLLRVVLVVFIWVVFVPLVTCWCLRACFARTLWEAPRILRLRWDVASVTADCFIGSLLSAAIILVFLGISSLRDHLREQAAPAAPADGPAPNDAAEPAPAAPEAAPGGGLDGELEDETPLAELIGITGPLKAVFENAATILASNAFCMAAFAFAPFHVGRTFLLAWGPAPPVPAGEADAAAAAAAWEPGTAARGREDVRATLYGYALLLASAAVIAALAPLRGGPHAPARAQAGHAARTVLLGVKVVALGALELFGFPLACGAWLDACTLHAGLVHATVASRLAFLHAAPVACLTLHWFLGAVFMLYVGAAVSVLREVARPELFAFLRDPGDPAYHPFRDLLEEPFWRHIRRIALSAVIYAPLALALVYAPTRLCRAALPFLFPLTLSFTDPFVEIPADLLLFHVLVPLTVERCSPRAAIRRAARDWLRAVSGPLGIAHLVLRDEAAAGPDGALPPPPPAPLSRPRVALAAALLAALAWCTLVAASCCLLALPVAAGRALVRLLAVPLSHDVYTGFLGLYVLWGLYLAAAFVARQPSLVRAARHAGAWLLRAAQAAALAALWLLLAPLLAGLVFEAAVAIPLRVPLDQTPLVYSYQTWAIGLLAVKVWVRLCVAEGALGAENRWRARFQRVLDDGLAGLQPLLTLREVVLPVLASLALALAAPYALARGLLPLLLSDPRLLARADRFAHLALFGLAAGALSAGRARRAAAGLVESIRDEAFGARRRLLNRH